MGPRHPEKPLEAPQRTAQGCLGSLEQRVYLHVHLDQCSCNEDDALREE